MSSKKFRNQFSLAIKIVVFAFAMISCSENKTKDLPKTPEKYIAPNFIFILADDQGWNGTSVQMMHNESGSKSDYFETPHLETRPV